MQTVGYALDITVNGQPLPLDRVPIHSVAIYSSKFQRVPVAEIIFSDPGSLLALNVTITDGSPVVISLGTNPATQRQYPMRVFKIKKVQGRSGDSYHILLYYDAPLYWRGTASVPFKGTSADAIAAIASTCGLKSYTEKTADFMTWLPMKETYSSWAEYIAKAAYLNDSSGFALGLRMDGILLLRDVAGYKYDDAAIPKFVGGLPAPVAGQNNVPLIGFKHGVISGYKNMIGGYHGQVQMQTVTSPSETTTATNVSKVRATKQLHMSTTVKSQLGDAPILQQSMIDAGNVHAHYQQALYQNERIDQVFSSILALLTTTQTSYDLLDRVIVNIYKMGVSGDGPTIDNNLSGNYHVIGKTVYADVTGQYAEKFIVATDGHNSDPANTRSDV